MVKFRFSLLLIGALSVFFSSVATAQNHYEFIGGGTNPTAFDNDPANWAPAQKQSRGVPKETKPGSAHYPYGLRLYKQVHLIIGAQQIQFNETIATTLGQLTINKGTLTFISHRKSGKGTNLVQGRTTVTLNDGGRLIFEGHLFLDKFRHADPVPWIVVNEGSLIVRGNTHFLAGEIRIGDTGAFETESINFGARYNTGMVNFLPGSKGSFTVKGITFEKAASSFEMMVRQGHIVIDGKRARWNHFKQSGDTLSLAH